MPSFVHKLKTLKGNVDLDNEVSGFSSSCLFPSRKYDSTKYIFPESYQEQTSFFFFFFFNFLFETLESGFISFLSIISSRAFGNKPSLCHSREMLEILPKILDSPLESFCHKSQGLFWAESLVWYVFF